jgi:hypothetical protein
VFIYSQSKTLGQDIFFIYKSGYRPVARATRGVRHITPHQPDTIGSSCGGRKIQLKDVAPKQSQ